MPWNRALLEKLVVAHLVKKFLSFYGTQKCIITVFIRAVTAPNIRPDASSTHIKVKLCLCLTKYHAIKAYRGSGGVAPLIL
jgi:hypothetical protein